MIHPLGRIRAGGWTLPARHPAAGLRRRWLAGLVAGFWLAGWASGPSLAAVPDPLLTVDRIFGAREFEEEKPPTFRWSSRSGFYHVLEPVAPGAAVREVVRHEAATGRRAVVVSPAQLTPAGAAEPLAVEDFEFSADESRVLLSVNTRRVWRRNTRGDYWVLDLAGGRLRRLGGAGAAPSSLQFAKFSPDGTRVAFVREQNLHVEDLRTGEIRMLTRDGSRDRVNGTGDWVNEEELDLRDGFRWSPDGRAVLFWQFDTRGVGEFTLVDHAAGNYPRVITFPYPKVGGTNSATRLGVVGARGGPVRWLRVEGDPRQHYLPRAEWLPDGSGLLLQQLNRRQNTNRVLRADPRSGAVRPVLEETDPAWLENENPFRWLARGREFLWLSERDGWRHVYRAGSDGRGWRQLTRGAFDVIELAGVDEAGGWLYFLASPGDPVRRFLHRVSLEGGAVERVTPEGRDGWHGYDVSPDGRWAVHTASSFGTPPMVELVELPGHRVARVLVDNGRLRERLATLRLPAPEFLRVGVGDGVELDAWALFPPDRRPGGRHPLLFHVYGEPHGQTVRDAWGGSRGLWQAMLAQQGYVVASVDNRGTITPRGRAWRKVVHRQVGILAPREQAAAARALLARWPWVDPARVGIWGWSGGGSMSLHALFRYPELYRLAMAVAPNPDQRLYDTIYQERYMGLPEENPEGYREGSPLTHAHRLRGDLLLVHGTGDDNVHYQATERLMDALVARGLSFTVMPYPGRSHSLTEGSNTVAHFHGLLTRYLHEKLPVGSPVTATTAATTVDRGTGGDGREVRRVAGWTVRVHAALLAADWAADTARALRLLEEQLEEIVRKVPAGAVAELRKVTLWMSPPYPGIGPRAEYHPAAGWLRSNGRDPAMAKGVEFTCVREFESESRRMPNFTLHELAHAFHDRVLPGGFDHAAIRSAFEAARAGGRYERVRRRDAAGRETEDRAYALTNPMEYFAEATEAYFSRNDFYPFNREELRAVDPGMERLLGRCWESGGREP